MLSQDLRPHVDSEERVKQDLKVMELGVRLREGHRVQGKKQVTEQGRKWKQGQEKLAGVIYKGRGAWRLS